MGRHTVPFESQQSHTYGLDGSAPVHSDSSLMSALRGIVWFVSGNGTPVTHSLCPQRGLIGLALKGRRKF